MILTHYDSNGKKTVYESDVTDIHPLDLGAMLSEPGEPREVLAFDRQLVIVNGKIYNQTVEIPAKTTVLV